MREKFDDLMKQNWELKKKLTNQVTAPIIDKLILLAEKNGARSCKLLGAGGGGSAKALP